MESKLEGGSGGQKEATQAKENTIESRYALNHLLPVIYELISQYLSGYDLMALQLTCSRGVVMRVRTASIKTFSITPSDHVSWSGAGFGSLKYFSRLTNIKLTDSNLSVLKEGPSLLNYFPPSIRSITLSLPFKLGFWLLIDPSHADRQFRKEHAMKTMKNKKPISPVHLIKQYEKAPELALSEIFPHLEQVKISGGIMHSLNVSRKEKNEEAAILPFIASLSRCPNLKQLSLPTWPCKSTNRRDQGATTTEEDMQSSLSTVPALFSRLQGLELSWHSAVMAEDALHHLPLGLQSLLVDASNCAFPTSSTDTCLQFFSKLPSSLEVFHLVFHQGTSYLDTASQGDDSNTDYLWSGFQLSPAGQGSLHTMIIELTSFTIRDENFFKILPSGLTRLEITLTLCGSSRVPDVSGLPPRLRHLRILQGPTLRSHALSFRSAVYGYDHLPVDIQILHLGSCTIMDDATIEKLPRNVSELTIQFSRLSFYPMNREEEETMKAGAHPVFPQIWLHSLSDACSSLLPPNVASLSLTDTYFGNQFLWQLPQNLTKLEFQTNFPKLDLECFNCLPSSLTQLRILKSPGIYPAALNYLSSGLKDLYYEENDSVWGGPPPLADKDLATLPASLTALHLVGGKEITDGCVRSLPRSLVRLTITLAHLLSASCLSLLPRSLMQLKVDRMVMPHPRPTRSQILAQIPHCLLVAELPWATIKNRRVDFSSLP